MRIAIIGGGHLGGALGRLLQAAQHEVRLGVREGGPADMHSVTVADAAAFGEVIILTIPYAAIASVLRPLKNDLQGKIIVDATNPVAGDWSPILLGQETSGGEETQRLLPASRVVKAFNTVFADMMTAERLAGRGGPVTALVASDDPAAADVVAGLARDAGFAPEPAGPLSSARWLEAMAHLNIRLAVTLGGGTAAAFVYRRTA